MVRTINAASRTTEGAEGAAALPSEMRDLGTGNLGTPSPKCHFCLPPFSSVIMS